MHFTLFHELLGYYSVNTQRVRENMRVVLPAVDDLSELGEYIQQECEDKTTYRLEKATDRGMSLNIKKSTTSLHLKYCFKITFPVYKRSISSAHELPFTEFAGLYTIDYDIVNLDQIGIQEHH